MSTVEEIVQAIIELSPENRDEVRRRLISLWPLGSREEDVEKTDLQRTYWFYHQSPSRIKRVRPRRPPIQIKGKPLSETVVEDRR
jgi:uncharacterized protein